MRFSLHRPMRPGFRTMPVLAASLALFLSVLCFSRTASAQRVYVYAPPPPPPAYGPPPPPRYYYYDYREAPYAFDLALDVEGAVPLNGPAFSDATTFSGGGGVKIRAGERIRMQPGMHITPEVGFGWEHLWASDDLGNGYDWALQRVFVGARLDFGHFVLPGIYAHLGYGWQNTSDPDAVNNGGLYYDFGGTLDFRIIPHLGFGAHVEYAAINMTDQISWLAVGVHGDVVF
jgi:hypothetical protein